MADNVAITAGTGTSVATDEVGSDHYQKIKLAVGVADSAVMIGHLEDAAHTTGDGGVMMLAVRKDSAAALAGTDGDYIPLIVDATGRLWIHSADLATIAGAVSGTEMQVDVVAALPAGTNAIGKLAANSGVDIGDVDVTSVIPGTGATNLGKATDSAAGATDTGVPPLAVRDDALSALTPVEGDYVPVRVDANGALWVIPSGTVTVDATGAGDVPVTLAGEAVVLGAGSAEVGRVTISDGTSQATVRNLAANDALNVAIVDASGNQVTSFGGSGGTSATDDSAFTPGSGSGTPVMGMADETTPDAVDEGDVGVVRMTLQRGLHVNLRDAAGAEVAKAEDAAHTTGDPGVPALAVRRDTAAAGSGTDGDYSTVNVDASGRLWAHDPVAEALLTTIDTDTGNAATSLAVMDDWDNAASDGCSVSGDVAHDTADAGEPVKIGAVARTTNVAAVADGDRVNASADDVGRLIIVPNSPRDLVVQQTTDTTNQTETTIVTAGAAGVFHDLLSLVITNASTTATVVTLRDATAGSAVGKYALAANGGIVLTFATPFKQTTAANNWTVQSSATVSLHIVAQAAKNV